MIAANISSQEQPNATFPMTSAPTSAPQTGPTGSARPPWWHKQVPSYRGPLASLVRRALRSSSLAGFRQVLRDCGYEFRVRGHNATLVPPNGARPIRLRALMLNTPFWVRFHEWGENALLLGWGAGLLPRFWRALTGDHLDADRRRSVMMFGSRLGQSRTMEAMCIAACRLRDEPAHNKFLYFCKVCWNWIRESPEVTAAKSHSGSLRLARPPAGETACPGVPGILLPTRQDRHGALDLNGTERSDDDPETGLLAG